MLEEYLWFIYALGAAILWGLQYATSEQLLKTIPPYLMAFGYSVAVGVVYLLASPWLQSELGLNNLKYYLSVKNLLLFVLVVILGCVSSLLIFSAIAKESSIKASIVEITYPFFVALFAILIYREDTPNWQTSLGGLLIFAGVILVLKS